MPEIKSITTLFFENLLPILKQHANIHMIWLVYQPDRINPPQKISDNVTIEDIHDYDNAIELLQKQKPDLIFASATRSFVDYAISTAAKSMGIPTSLLTIAACQSCHTPPEPQYAIFSRLVYALAALTAPVTAFDPDFSNFTISA